MGIVSRSKAVHILPCNVIVQELQPWKVEVDAADPAASIQAGKNDKLAFIAGEIKGKL